MSSSPAIESAKPARSVSLFAGSVAVLIGSAALVGWAFEIGVLKSIHPDWVAMKPNTAVGLVLIGIATLVASGAFGARPAVNWVGRAGGALAGAFGLFSIVQYVFDWNPGFDQWLFPEPAGAVGTSHLGRMAPETAVCFMLVAAALGGLPGPRPWRGALVVCAVAGLLVTTLALAALLCYFTPSLGSFGWLGLTVMAVPTAGAFAALGVAVISATWQPTAKFWALSRRTAVAFACGLSILMVIGLNTNRTQTRMHATALDMANSEALAGAITELLAGISHTQNHTRGFVITGEERYRQSMLAAAATSRASLDQLIANSNEDPVWRAARDRVAAAAQEALAWFPRVVAASETGMDAATRREMVGHGEDLLDRLRAGSELALAEARVAVERAKHEVEAVGEFANTILTAGTLLSLAIFLTVLFGLNQAEGWRRRAEAVNAANQRLLHAITDNSTSLIYAVDPAGKILLINRALEKVLGQPRETMLGGSREEFMPPAIAAAHRENDCKVIEGGQPISVEEQTIEADGIHTYLSVKFPLVDDEGRVMGVGGISTDVTARARMEEALRTSELEFRTLAEAMPQIVWATGPDGLTNYFNRQWVDYTGLSLEQSYGDGWNAPFHPDDRQRAWEAWQRATQGLATYSLECRLRGADGVYRWWLVRGEPLRDASGQIIKWFGTYTDIESIKQAEKNIRRLNAELEQRVAERTAALEATNRELEAFSYSVSHDLRAPLRSIDGFSRILLDAYGEKFDEEGRDNLQRVRAAAQRMGRLIDDLLNLSRVTRAEMRREHVDLSALARAVAEELRRADPQRAATIAIADGLSARGDPHLLRVILENLLGNAWKFTARRESAHIEIGVDEANGEPHFFVRDNGAGFDPAYSHKLFGAFQRLHSTEEFPGTGIGLATVQRIAQRHGGRAWARGDVGKGAAFYFSVGGPGS